MEEMGEVKGYWWRGVSNFGDALAPFLLERFANAKVEWAPAREAEVASVGSILEHLPSDYTGYVLGSGKLREGSVINLPEATILALRGHWYGAMMQIFPRVAFDIVGGWDIRFRGWGGEDHSAMRAMDTLYAPHKTLPGQILHLWHPMMGKEGHRKSLKSWVTWSKRLWDDQDNPGDNNRLATRYSRANGNRKRMRRLIMEWQAIEDQAKV